MGPIRTITGATKIRPAAEVDAKKAIALRRKEDQVSPSSKAAGLNLPNGLGMILMRGCAPS
jgi:hypothetical protein